MFLALLPQSIATMSLTYVYGKEYSQWNIPVTGARGMCGTFTSIILGSMIVGPITDVFLDTITSHAAHLHCISLPRRNKAWANIWDAHQHLDLASQIDLHCQPYEHANQLGSVLESLHVGDGLGIVSGAYTISIKRTESEYVLFDSHGLPHKQPIRTLAVCCPPKNVSLLLDIIDQLVSD